MRPRHPSSARRRHAPLLRLALVAALAAACSLAPAPAVAQTARFAGTSERPVEIYAKEGIEWRQNDRVYIARGDAVAKRGETTLHGDVLTAHYREAGEGKTEIFRLDAEGHVRVATETQTAYGDRGVYDIDQGVAVLKGRNLRLETETETVTARDSLEYWDQQQMAVARGNAVARTEDKKLRGDVLSALLRENERGEMEIYRVEAFGNVLVTTPTEVARGERGVYNVETGIATLMGSVKITRGENQLNGEYGEVNMNTGVSRLLAGPPSTQTGARVKALLHPKSESGESETKETKTKKEAPPGK